MSGSVRVALLVLTVAALTAPTLAQQEHQPEAKILQPGVRLTMIAEHPELATPTGVDVDRQGRVWVAASHTHFRPDDYQGPAHDEVLVFADGNRRVFFNQTEATMDLELGPDGWVYLAERDRILRVKDTDGDGAGDRQEEIAALDTEADYPHNGMSGLCWHPSGDLVFSLGENYAQPWTLTGADGAAMQGSGEGGIFRCRPDGTKLRRIAKGFWNPFGVCAREDGQMFAAENDPGARPPCRLLHIVEGGDYGYQRRYGPAAHHPFVCWNGGLRGTLPMVHPTGEAPCAVLPLGGGLIVPSWTDHRIDFYALQEQGASYTAQRTVLLRGGANFRPVCIAQDPSISSPLTFYFTDWVFVSYQLHGRGRLWKLEIDTDKADWLLPASPTPPNELAQLAGRLRQSPDQFSVAALFQHARHDDPFVSSAALNALAKSSADWTIEDVRKLKAEDRRSAVVAMKLAGRKSLRSLVKPLLSDDDPQVVFEMLRWVADAQLESFLPEVERLLERSGLDYRLFEAGVATWNTLTGRAADGVRNTEMLLRRAKDSQSSPKLRAFALRLLPELPTKASASGEVRKRLPRGLSFELLKSLSEIGDETLSLEVVRVLAANATPEAMEILATLAADASQPTRLRCEAVAGLAAAREERLGLLIELAKSDDRPIREEALRALRGAQFSDRQANELEAVGENRPASSDLVQAALHPQEVAEARPAASNLAAWRKRLEAVSGPADVTAGERIFHHPRLALCARCHRHGGRGGVVGPDLSGVHKRGDRSWLLESLLRPNVNVAPEYRARSLTLKDGRTFTGIHLRTGGGADVETLRDANGQERRFPRAEIETSHEVMTSLMPEGLSETLTIRELRDLVAFLESAPN